MRFAEIIIDIPHDNVDKIFTYTIPETFDLQKGMRVIVPFGAKTFREGICVGITDKANFPANKMKPVEKIIDASPTFSENMLSLAFWMKEKYYATYIECLHTIMPAGLKVKADWFVKAIDSSANLQGRAKEVLDFLNQNRGQASRNALEKQFGPEVLPTIRSLENKKIISVFQKLSEKKHIKKIKYAEIDESHQNIEELIGEYLNNKLLYLQGETLALVWGSGFIAVNEIKDILQITDSPIRSLVKKGFIKITEEEVKKDIFDISHYEKFEELPLNEEQIAAVQFCVNEMHSAKPILLHGVTGSGKTEVYMRLIDEVLKNNQQAIVLVPEISLTPQMVSRFIGRFGKKVAFTHSRLSYSQRFGQWKKAKDGDISIMIGPRSALFTPFDRLGTIIIDEEHENTYKSETTPKYDAREVAEKLSTLTGCLLVLGSATPSIETYYRTQTGTIHLIKLMERTAGSQLPTIHTADMREEFAAGNRSIFCRDLLQEMDLNLQKNQQTILFLNRRGHSTFVSCRNCGSVIKCDSCSVAFTYHQGSSLLICHYCGKKIKSPRLCPACGSPYIKFFGIGTQRVEEEVKKIFPSARTLRMDADTTIRKYSHEKILTLFANREADILVGTQMIAKGHDFPFVTLVGVVAADISLNTGDFRSAENTCQLISQVAGRAGRAGLPGRVYVQTYSPEHYSIVLSKEQNYEKFYEAEIKIREQMKYPPFSHFFLIMFSGEKEKNVIQYMFQLSDILQKYNTRQFEILGPAPAMVSKINNRYRWKMLVKFEDEPVLKNYVLYCINKLKEQQAPGGIAIHIVLDPASII